MPDSHGDLALLLRSWRDRLSPADVGLSTGGHRRASGLRREEVASLAGLSVDYVIRLEQGRARTPSDQVAAALARALQLSDSERDHLFRVSGLLPPSAGEMPRHIPPGVHRLVARLGECPVGVFTASWDLLAWSPLWTALLGDPSLVPASSRNLLRGLFLLAPSERFFRNEVTSSISDEVFQATLVADLRRVQGRYPDDRSVRSLVDDLTRGSSRFAALWNTGAVGEQQSERKVIRHPQVGDIELDCDVFSVAGTDIRIVAYTAAANSPSAEKIDFLRVTGIAALSASAPL